MRIEIPQINKWEKVEGVEKILNALASTFQEQGQATFNFSYCHFISAEAIAILAGAKLLRDEKRLLTDVDINTLDYKVKRVLGKSRFLELFGCRRYPWKNNSLPVYVQHSLSKEGIVNYIDEEILRRYEMPEMSGALQKEIRRSFFELFNNVFYHSQSPIGGLVCGQVYPRDKEIQIVFYDAGVGIAKCVRKAVSSIPCDEEAIAWALKRGTSTLSNHNESRGLGLYLLRQFLRVNGGEFRIYANQGIVEEISGHRSCNSLRNSLNGTLIDMRIKVRNDVKYILSSEDET